MDPMLTNKMSRNGIGRSWGRDKEGCRTKICKCLMCSGEIATARAMPGQRVQGERNECGKTQWKELVGTNHRELTGASLI